MTPEAVDAVSKAHRFPWLWPLSGPTVTCAPTRTRIASRQPRGARPGRKSRESSVPCPASNVCVVSGGDPGVFAMAAAVCEAIDNGPDEWRTIDLVIVPGVTAMLAVAARIGAPLGHDFCAISLSDNLKPWDVITRRFAAGGRSRSGDRALQSDQQGAALAARRSLRDPARPRCRRTTPVIFGRAAGRPDERMLVDAAWAGGCAEGRIWRPASIIGSPETRIIPRPAQPDLVYTPRFISRGEKVIDKAERVFDSLNRADIVRLLAARP